MSSSVIAVLNFGYKEYDVLKKKNVYKPLRYFIGIRVPSNEWNITDKLPYSVEKRREIESIGQQISDIFNYLKFQGNITPELLKAELDEKLKGKTEAKIVKKVRIVDFIRNEILPSKDLKESSKSPYRNVANKLDEFENFTGKPLYTNDLDEQLYKLFMDRVKLKLTRINAVWAINKVMTATLNEIARRYKIDVFKPAEQLAKKDKVHQVTADKVYLNFEQIKKVLEFDPQTEKLRNAKLILITLLFTGCRHSDVHKILPDNLYEKNDIQFFYSRYFTDKTDTEIIVPILKPLEEAIEANGGKVAYKISQQKFNEYAKELLQACGLDEPVTITYTDKNGKKQFETKALYQFVSSHIGRRSLVTNLLNHISTPVLSKITGHSVKESVISVKDNSAFWDYNKIALIDNAVLFRKQLKRAAEDDPGHFPFELV